MNKKTFVVDFRKRNIDQKLIEQIIEFRKENTVKATSEKFNVSSYQIRHILRKRNISINYRNGNKFSKEFIDDILTFYRECKNLTKTAQHFKIDRSTIRKYCLKNSIDIVPCRKGVPRPNLTEEQQKLFNDHYEKVKQIISAKGASWRAKLSGIEFEDVFQAGLIALWRCCLTYDPSTGCSFSTLLGKAVSGEMYEVVELARYGRRVKNRPLIDQSKFLEYIEEKEKDDSYEL